MIIRHDVLYSVTGLYVGIPPFLHPHFSLSKCLVIRGRAQCRWRRAPRKRKREGEKEQGEREKRGRGSREKVRRREEEAAGSQREQEGRRKEEGWREGEKGEKESEQGEGKGGGLPVLALPAGSGASGRDPGGLPARI